VRVKGVGVLAHAASDHAAEVVVAVGEAGQDRLAATVDSVRAGIAGEQRLRGPDRDDAVLVDDHRAVVEDGSCPGTIDDSGVVTGDDDGVVDDGRHGFFPCLRKTKGGADLPAGAALTLKPCVLRA
jgi:hypothetical protein